MFDAHARNIIDSITDLSLMDRTEVRRLLSTAYVEIIRARGGATAADGRSRDSISAYLRRLTAALESAAVFDDALPNPPSADVSAASAFVAAESLALAVDLQESPPDDDQRTRRIEAYDRLEASLLYLIGGYDINAVAIARPALALASDDDPIATLLRVIARFCSGDVSQPYSPPEGNTDPDAVASTRRAVAAEGVAALDAFRAWLIGDVADSESTIKRLSRLCNLLRNSSTGRMVSDLADLFHITSLLHVALCRTRGPGARRACACPQRF